MPKFSISVVCYTNLEGARACIASVLVNSRDFELILTANGNPEAARFFCDLQRQYPGIVFPVVNDTNLGFIEPNRRALNIAQGTYVVLLNDDATVPPGWLDMLEAPFRDERNPRAAITGAVGGCRTLTEEYDGNLGPHLDYIEGSCMCCKVEIMRRLPHGLFAPYLFFAYCEDSDLCLRVKQAGYTIHEAPFSIIHHRGGTSAKLPADEAKVLWAQAAKNREACLERWAYYLKYRRFAPAILIRRNAAWGDVLLTTPIIRALKEQVPGREIFVESALCEVFDRNPDVTRAAQTIEGEDAVLLDLDMAYENRPGVHIVDAYARSVGLVSPIARKTILVPDPRDLQVERGVMKEGKWVAIHAGPTTWKGKNWSMDNWNDLAAALRKRGFKIVLVGNTPDSSGELIPHNRDARGKTSVSRLAAILSCCKLLIGVDSFPLHVAQSQGTPVVGLFGVTSPEFILTDGSLATGVIGHGPMTGARHKVSGSVCVDSDGAEMADITPRRVMLAVNRLLAAVKARKTP